MKDDTPARKRGRPPKSRSSVAEELTAGTEKPAKAKRGRPKASAAAQTGSVPEKETVKNRRKNTIPATTTSLAISTGGKSPDFAFALRKTEDGWALSIQDRKGKPFEADYRLYSGRLRDALREFDELRKRKSRVIAWDFAGGEKPGDVPNEIQDPTARLVGYALDAGRLVGSDGKIITRAPGEYRCGLSVSLGAGKAVTVTPDLSNDEGESVAHDKLYAITPSHVVAGSVAYAVPDLGTFWPSWDIGTTRIARENVPAFLSLFLSRFPAIALRYADYAVSAGRPLTAQAALLFREIDAYGYLHVRPLVSLEGYPPEFFEDQDITRIASIDDEKKALTVSEVVFPEMPADSFRSLLAAMGKESKQAVYEEAGIFILAPEFAADFLSANMGQLLSRFALLESSLLTKYKLRVVKPKLRLSLGKGIDYLEGSATVDLADESIPFGRFMAEYRKSGYVVLSDGSRAWPDARELSRFERLITKTKGSDDAVAVSFFDIPALARSGDFAADGESWKKAERFFTGYNSIADRKGDFTIPDGELRPYQIYGVKWLEYLRDHGFGACLADEMGLGKTVQVITLLRRAYAGGLTGPSLVLVPRSLIFNWQRELGRFAPELTCAVHYGAGRDETTLKDAGDGTVIVTSYATARNDIDGFLKREFAYVILDESQNVKNLETQTAGAVLSLRARHRLALSGTPIENSLADLYSLFRFLNPNFFGGETEFSRKYLRPIQEGQDEDAMRDLRSRVNPFMLRRAKRDVLKDLPPKTEQVAYIELDARHLELYHRRREELRARVTGAVNRDGVGKNAFLILQALTELRRLAGVPEADGEYEGTSAKREYLREMVVNIAAEGHKCLIFTNYLASIDLISEDLAAAGVENLVMTGATGDRQSLVQKFQTDPAIRAFIMTLKTGGVGLNLTAADYVFIFDPWWNRAAEAQAIDRTHRIGQTNPVFCYRMIARETIEEKILELQERKAGLVANLLASDAGAVKSLTEDDIAHLLG